MYGHLKYKKIQTLSTQFLSINNEKQIGSLLGIPSYQLMLLSLKPQYNVFEIKKETGFRLIEAPSEPVMKILKKLKNYLQSVYYLYRTDAAYGFILHPTKEKFKRNILSNAKHHLGNDYLLNIDLKDFFHQISYSKIEEVFNSEPFDFSNQLIHLLCRLTTYTGRLPIGSPTSPPLSNLAMIPVDNELMHYAKSEKLKFTRFVDDLTFSSHFPISQKHFLKIEELLKGYQLEINYDKIKTYSADDTKVVTGLELKGESVVIPNEFFDKLDKDITRIKSANELNSKYGGNSANHLLTKAEMVVRGKLNFIELVYNRKSDVYKKYFEQFTDALNASDSIESVNWLDLPYQFI